MKYTIHYFLSAKRGPNNDIREEVIGNTSTNISKRYSSQEVGQKWKDRLPNKRKGKENI